MPRSLEKARPGPRVERSKEALRRALVEALEDLPFAQITIAPLAERAGVGYATLFRHYRDKEALLADVADTLVADLVARTLPMFESGDALSTAQALVARIEQDRALCRTLLSGAGDTIRNTVTNLAVEAATADGQDRAGLPAELAARFVVGATLTILGWWLAHPAAMTADQAAGIIHRLVLAPLGAAGGPGQG